MSALCFVTSCMGRLRALRQTLGSVDAQLDSTVVVVDYSCPEGSGDWVESAYPGVRVVRESGQTRYNHSRSRNLGARAATDQWLCFCDADILFAPTFAAAVVPMLHRGHYYRPDPLDDLGIWGTFVCHRADFERVGGYDEVYQGWGDEDMDLYDALEMAGVKRQNFSASLLRHLPHDDAERVRFYDNKNRWLNCSINRLYRVMKSHLIRVRGQTLTPKVRELLYRLAATNVNAAVGDGQPRQVTLELGDVAVMPGDWELSCCLTFRYYQPGVRRLESPDGSG